MLDALRWWLAFEAIAIAALPITLVLFRALPDRGYAFNKAVALAVVAYTFWILNSAHLLPNTTAGILISVSIVAAASAAMLVSARHDLLDWFRRSFAYITVVEAVTFAVFASTAWFRSFNGQIVYGEKRMEFMYLNAIRAADHFPPQDAWLAGRDVSYYYFGYLMTDVVARLAAVPTEIAFNLGFAMFIAAAAATMLGLAYNCIAAAGGPESPPPRVRLSARPLRWALGAVALLLLLGNLVGVFLLSSAFGIGSDGFYSWFDVEGLTSGEARHLWYPAQAYGYTSSGTLFVVGTTVSSLESPILSIYIGDLHPHVMGLPFALLGVGIALTVALGHKLEASPRQLFPRAAMFGLLAGSTGFVNSWDLPPLLVLVVGIMLLRSRGSPDIRLQIASAGVLIATAVLAYLPFYLSLDHAGNAIFAVAETEAVNRPGSRPAGFVLHSAPLFTAMAPFLWFSVWPRRESLTRSVVLAAAAMPVALVLAWMVLFLAQTSAGVAELSSAPDLGAQIATRGWSWLSTALAASLLIFALMAVVIESRSGHQPESRIRTFVALIIAVAAALILAAEFFYVGDVLHSRLNTLFKFSYLAWALLSVAATYSLYDLVQKARRREPGARGIAIASSILLAAGLLTPVGAIPNRIHPTGNATFANEPNTLDGIRWYDPDERGAIEWLRDHAHGQQQTLVESVVDVDGRTDFSGAGRLSMASGMPSVLAWPVHQQTWRGSSEPLGTRAADVDVLYRTTAPAEAEAMIARYSIDYIAVGIIERAVYPAASLAKFEAYPVAFRQGNVVIYAAPD